MYEENKITVYFDYRESRSQVPKRLTELGVLVQGADLPCDYIVAGKHFIERKTIPDFISSIADGRLFRQISYLEKHYVSPMVVLEGGGLYLQNRVPDNAIRGVMLWIAVTKQVPLIRTFNAYDTACVIRLLVNRQGSLKNKGVGAFKRERKNISPWQQQANMLAEIPGVGWQTAKDILKVFGSVSNMSSAPDSELLNLKGFGGKRLASIRQIFPQTTEHK